MKRQTDHVQSMQERRKQARAIVPPSRGIRSSRAARSVAKLPGRHRFLAIRAAKQGAGLTAHYKEPIATEADLPQQQVGRGKCLTITTRWRIEQFLDKYPPGYFFG